MVVNASDVRLYLNDVATDLISDDSLNQAISLAETVVSEEASSTCKLDTKDHAILAQAGWIAYGKYASHVERAMGKVPTKISGLIKFYEYLKNIFMKYVRSGDTLPPNIDTLIYPIDSAMTGWYRRTTGSR